MDSEGLRALVSATLVELSAGAGERPAGPRAVAVRPRPDAGPGSYVTGVFPPAVADEVLTAVEERLADRPELETARRHGRTLRLQVTLADLLRSMRILAESAWAPDPLPVAARPIRFPGSRLLLPAEAAAVVGADAVAYHTARTSARGAHEPLDLDPEQAVRRTLASPLFLVQYAHSRAAAVTAQWEELGPGPVGENEQPWEPHPAEDQLVGALVELPATVARAVRRADARGVPRHLEEVADRFLALDAARPVLPAGDDEVTGSHRGRLLLAAATRGALRSGLAALGVQAPRRC